MTRTEAICQAVVAELRRRRQAIDDGTDLASVTVTVRLQATADPVRAITYEDHRIVTRRQATCGVREP